MFTQHPLLYFRALHPLLPPPPLEFIFFWSPIQRSGRLTDVQVQELLQTKCDKLETDDRCKAFSAQRGIMVQIKWQISLNWSVTKLQWATLYTWWMMQWTVLYFLNYALKKKIVPTDKRRICDIALSIHELDLCSLHHLFLSIQDHSRAAIIFNWGCLEASLLQQ